MNYALEKYDNLIARNTQQDDLDFVISAERSEENAEYVGQWTKQQHSYALRQKDFMHLIIEEEISAKSVGYAILAGLQNPNHNIEFIRLVITDKGKSFGRKSLKIVKSIAFEQLKAHRLWLDVRNNNQRAQNLYQSEGFTREGVLRECIIVDGSYESLIIMSILENEYIGG